MVSLPKDDIIRVGRATSAGQLRLLCSSWQPLPPPRFPDGPQRFRLISVSPASLFGMGGRSLRMWECGRRCEGGGVRQEVSPPTDRKCCSGGDVLLAPPTS